MGRRGKRGSMSVLPQREYGIGGRDGCVIPAPAWMERLWPQKVESMEPVLRAKMRVESVSRSINEDGSVGNEQVKLRAVYGPEGSPNGEWSKWTPSASFDITINNPAAHGALSKGHEFYVDFTPAE